MCGIAGAFSQKGVPSGVVEAATAAIAHRGPDDSGVRRISVGKGEAILGNRRLSIIDLSPAGHMPMADAASGSWITYNGEIYNFRELKQELAREGMQFKSETDTEVILQGYLKHGRQWFARLRGMFGLAIYDGRRQEIVLARDRFGIKPLYYVRQTSSIYFASEVRPLLPVTERKLDPVGLYQFLSFGSVSEPNTLIAGVHSLPAGCTLVAKGDRTQIEPYVKLRDAFDARSTDDLPAARVKVAELVRDSLQKHIVSDVPVSLFLSGGIDSAVLAVALRQLEVSSLHSFSIIFQEADLSEAEDAKLIAQKAGTTHHEILLSQRQILRDIPTILRAMDQPSFDGVNSYVISAAVRKAGYKVALSGLGGDEVFAGYSTFSATGELLQWQRRVKVVPPPFRWVLPHAAAGFSQSPDQKRKLRTILSAPFPYPYGVLRTMFVPQLVKQIAVRHEASVSGDALDPLAETLNDSAGLDPVNRVSYLELTNYMRNTLLRDTDCMSMANSLEVRVPFIDHELIGYVASLPGALKVDRSRPKSLLTAAFADVLPEETIYKRKQGFTLPFAHWLRDEMKEMLSASFRGLARGPLAGHLEPKAVEQVWDDFLRGRTSWTRPWSLFVLERWCQYNLT